jgi:hypothetical protein
VVVSETPTLIVLNTLSFIKGIVNISAFREAVLPSEELSRAPLGLKVLPSLLGLRRKALRAIREVVEEALMFAPRHR